MDSYGQGVQIQDLIDPNKFRDFQLRRLEREAQRRKEIERLNAELPFGPVTKDLEGVDLATTLLWDHVILAGDLASTKSKRLTSAIWLAREIFPKKPFQEVALAGCVILALGESGAPQIIRIEHKWIKDPDGKQVYERPDKLPMFRYVPWAIQKARKYARELELDLSSHSRDDPDLKSLIQDPRDYPSQTMPTALDPEKLLIATVDSIETCDEVAQLLEIAAPKQQELLQELLQGFRDNPVIKPRQARLDAYQNLEISPAAGRQLLHRIRK